MNATRLFKHLAGTLALASILIFAGCDTISTPQEEALEAGAAGGLPAGKAQGEINTLDDAFAAVAEQVPGFGGAYFDEAGTLVLLLTDPGQQEAARAALEEVLGGLKERGISSPERGRAYTGKTDVQEARYDYRELHAWRTRASDVLGLKGVLSLGIDERTNRLHIGILSEEAAEQVEAFLAKQEIPREAVAVEKAEPTVTLATLRDKVNPKRGGLQIAFDRGFCTLGFNISGPYEVRRYVTNSHCTNTAGVREGTRHYQPTMAAGNIMGYEISDPAGWACSGRQCRWSDSAIGQYYAGVPSDLGGIARPTTWGRWSGPLTISSTLPPLRITSERAFPFGGEMLDKVGRSTGWTYGYVTDTCDDINVFERGPGGTLIDTGRTLRCQDQVTGGVMPGDSGSSVFYWRGYNVDLYGILWGGYENARKFVFSAMWNIEADLGGLTTH